MIYTDLNAIMKMLKKIMIDYDIKQKNIAEKSGLSAQTISNLLACRRDGITLDTLNLLCNAMNCNLIIDIQPKNDSDNTDV